MTTNICQVALSVSDLYCSRVFYAQLFELDDLFGTTAFRGALAGAMQGLDNPASCTRWLTDDRPFFQLELFQYEVPRPKPLPRHHDVTHCGYNRLIIAVRSLELIAMRLLENGFSQRVKTREIEGNRFGLLTDPDGLTIELIEDGRLVSGSRNAKLIGIGLTCMNFDTTRTELTQGLGFIETDDRFNHQQKWNVDNRLTRWATLAHGDFFLVLSSYQDATPRPQDYALVNLGLMNFAIGYPDKTRLLSQVAATQALGMQTNTTSFVADSDIGACYNSTTEGFSVEMLYCHPRVYGAWGFDTPTEDQRRRCYEQALQAHAHYSSRHSKLTLYLSSHPVQ